MPIRPRPSRFRSLLDDIHVGVFWAGLAASVVLFGVLYALVGGLVPPSGESEVHWYDYFYFSVVTEATLGYGDFRPTSWAKLVAVIQVSFGLIWVGLLVAKLASLRTRRARRIAASLAGWWWDWIVAGENRRLIGLNKFFLDESGLLRFSGTNYDAESGESRGPFDTWFVGDSWPWLIFLYYNEHRADFDEGKLTIQVNCVGEEDLGKPVSSYTATIRDYRLGTMSITSSRLLDEDAAIAEAGDPEDVRQLVFRLTKRAWPE